MTNETGRERDEQGRKREGEEREEETGKLKVVVPRGYEVEEEAALEPEATYS